MSVLESIRKRTGLLVGIVGLALVIFVLQTALSSTGSGPSSDDNSVGSINGVTINFTEMQERVAKIREEMSRGGQEPNEQQRSQAIPQAWEELIRELVNDKEYEKLGIVCTDEELTDQMLIHPHSIIQSQFRDQQTGKFSPEFTNPDGSFNVKALNQTVKGLKPEQEKAWIALEGYVKQTRLQEKYTALIKYGLYTTTSETKMMYNAQTASSDVRFVLKKYSSIADTTVKITDADIQSYYNDHLYEFQNDVPSRSIEYVSWDVVPSAADGDSLMSEMKRVANDFRAIKADEDSSFTALENEGMADVRSIFKKELPPEVDSTFLTSPAGTVYGPFRENNMTKTMFKVIKMRGTEEVRDSAMVRHILVMLPNPNNPNIKRSPAQSKSLADSLLALLKKDGKRFDEFVTKYSDDGGKNRPDYKSNPQILMDRKAFPKPGDTTVWTGKGGNYGWLNDASPYVPSFKDFGLKGKKGDLGIVESNYGYHIMEVLDVSKTSKTKYKIATVSRELIPSETTRQDFMQKASDFAGKNNSNEKFQKGVEAMGLNKRLATDIKESDPFIPGFQNPADSPKELIRWVYKANAGDVSSPFTIGERIIVAAVTKVKEKGATALEFVKDDVKAKVMDQKKAEIILKDFNEKKATCKNIDEFAAKTGLVVEKMDKLQFGSYSVPVYGKEDELIATASVTKKGMMSPAGKGTAGVWVLQVENVYPAAELKDLNAQKKMYWQSLSGRAGNEPMDALKKVANIEDHKAKFDY